MGVGEGQLAATHSPLENFRAVRADLWDHRHKAESQVQSLLSLENEALRH